MARINIDPTKIKTAPKFRAARIKFNWPPHHFLGFLCAFWGTVADNNETGEISDWTPEYLAETIGLGNVDPSELWEVLVECGYIEQRSDGRVFVQDWLEMTEPYLRKKYHNSDPQRLVNIWALYGRIYGREPKTPKTEGNQKEIEPDGPDFLKEFSPFPKGSKKEMNPPDIIKEPPKDEEKRIPSGLATSAILEIHNPEAQAGEGERRGKKRLPEVGILSKKFYALLKEKFPDTSVDFNWGRAGKEFTEMLENNIGVQEIAMRFPNYFASTHHWIVGQGFSVAEFRRQFNLLEVGPITEQKSSANQDNTHGRKPFYDGEGNSPDYKYDESIVHKY